MAVVIGIKMSGSPTLKEICDQAKNQKSASGVMRTRSIMAHPAIIAPAVIRYLGCTKPRRPAISIMPIVTAPPGEIARPAHVAV